jgi:hypothetical protein
MVLFGACLGLKGEKIRRRRWQSSPTGESFTFLNEIEQKKSLTSTLQWVR